MSTVQKNRQNRFLAFEYTGPGWHIKSGPVLHAPPCIITSPRDKPRKNITFFIHRRYYLTHHFFPVMFLKCVKTTLTYSILTADGRKCSKLGASYFPDGSVVVADDVFGDVRHFERLVLFRTKPSMLTHIVHRDSKNTPPNCCPYRCYVLIDFPNSIVVMLSGKFAIELSLKIPPHLKRVTTLPCETRML